MDNNILVLLVDQWPADCFGHRGANIKTPNIDQLASEGVVFTNAFTTCPLCTPARGALFTGLWHNQSGVTDNMGIGYSQQEALSMKVTTWLDAGVANGYHMGYYGKWHLGPDGPIERGVQKHPDSIEKHMTPYVVGESDYSFSKWKKKYEEYGQIIHEGKSPYYGLTNQVKSESNPYLVAGQANEFLSDYVEMKQDKPFFLTVSINDPHFPHYLPEGFVKENKSPKIQLPLNHGDTFDNKPDFQNKAWWPSMEVSELDDKTWEEIIRFAYTHRILVDEALGSVLEQLKKLQLDRRTTVVFVSDHGDMCGAHNRFDKGPYFYDEVWRIPLIVKKPEVRSYIETSMVSILDVGATLFDLAGSKTELELAGKSLLPMMTSENTLKDSTEEVYGMYDCYNGMSFKVRAIRNTRYKYIYNPQSIDELYDLENDPIEMNNIINLASHKDIRATLSQKLHKWMEEINDTLPGELADLPEAGTIIVHGTPGP